MADELGGLFDSDPSFLEELASGSRANLQPGMIGQQTGVPQTAMIGQPRVPVQNMGRVNQMQQQQQGFGTNMGGERFPGAGQFQQQQQMNTGQFNQFSNQQMGQQMQMMPGQGAGTQQGHVSQMMSPHRNPQFAQAQQGMVLQQPQGQMQVNVTAPPGPRLPNPQQQIMMGQGQGQMQGWNVQMYSTQQQQGQTQYVSHHDYAIPSSNSGNTNFQNQMIGNQATFVRPMASPTGQPQPTRMPARPTVYANQRMPFGQNFPNSQQVMTNMNSNQMVIQQQQQQQQFIQHNQQPNNVMQMQQFRMNANPQIQQQGMINSPQQNIVRFSQTSPNQGSVQHRLPFTSMPQQRQTVPMLSPRPTPPPPSPSGSQGVLSPTGSTSISQSNIVQSVGMTSGNSANLFSQGANSDMTLSDMTPQKQFNIQGPSNQMMSPPQGGTTNNLSQIASPNPNSGQVNVNVSATVNSSSNNFTNGPNQVSPTHRVLSPNMNSPSQNVKVEIQTLNQQIQQLYNMPQTQETQQKLLDLQERLRSVKSQQMVAAQRQGQGQQLPVSSQQQQIMTSISNMTQQTSQTPQSMSEPQQTAQQMLSQTVQQQQNVGLQQEQQQNIGLQQQQKVDDQQQNIAIQQSQQQNTGVQLQQQQQLSLHQNVSLQQQPIPGQQNTSQVQQQIPNAVQQSGNMQPVATQQQPGIIRQPVGGQPGVQGQQGFTFKINTQAGQRIQLVRGPAQPGGGPQKIFIIQPQQASSQQQQQPQSSLPVPASGNLAQPGNVSQPVSSSQPLLKTIPQPQHVIINTSLSSGGNAQLGQTQVVQGQTQIVQGQAQIVQGQAQILPSVQGVRPQRMPIPVQVQIPQQIVQNNTTMPQSVPQPQLMQNTQMMGNPQIIGNVQGIQHSPVPIQLPQRMQHSPVPVQLPQGMQHSPVPVQIVRDSEQENSGSVSQHQEKANKIIAEAIAKAQRTGAAIPKVMSPAELPSTLTEVDLPDSTNTPADTPTKVKRKRKPREPKKDKSQKKKREKIKVEATDELSNVDIENTTEDGEWEEGKEKKKKKKREAGERKPKLEKTPLAGKKKKKPPATFLKNKKRKRRGSSDGSDVEIKFTPPPSPLNDDLKRRSGRHTKRKKYNDELDLELSDEDTMDAPPGETEGAVVKPVQLFVENPAEEDAVVVEKILGSRMRTKDADVSNDEDEEDDVEEYYVKYKNFSYLHCEWKTEKELMKDKRIPGKIRRFKIKKAQNNCFSALDDEELFNPEYVEVDRVLEESVTLDPNTNEEVTHYLVKWRGLPYEDSTWELQQDVDPEKVRLFKKFRELPDEEDRQYVRRPSSGSDWKALAKTHKYKNGNTLREYQLEGVNWLTFSWYKRQNCILADEMGLGKTIQSITFLQEIFNYGIVGPFLVVAPLSTIGNWMREFDLWTDMNVIVYHGTSPSRFMLQEYEMYYKDEKGCKIRDFYKFHVIITTYELIISDLEVLRDIDWRCVIIDEAHRLKNMKCRLMEGLRFFDFEHKVLLSGTPLQNNCEELFSLLNFLEPSQFHSSTEFLAEFGTLRTEEQVDKLKAILKPMMLRRLKEDVEKNLAAKEETIIEVELTNIQKKYYRAILEKNFSFLHKGTQSSANVPNLMNTMMELRKCCNHPYLINGAEENILSEMMMKQQSLESDPVVQSMIQASGKFVLLDKLLPKLKQSGHKVLIFSQMIRVLDILEDYLVHKRYLYERIDGRITGNLRQEAIDRFSKPDSDRFVFLLCTRAGGLGINLTAADTVIIYDSDWNPQNDLQAQARCHRIGQLRMVKVYRLITRNSYEREMFDRASMKLGLDKAVLQSMGGEKINPQAQLSKREIEELLRKGAYGALMEDDNAGDAFCEEDIDQILQGRTQVIQIESEGKGSTFAKASFSMTGNRDDIDINDPEFWQKWAKKADVDVDAGEKELIIEEPRVRKKTTRYGNDNGVVDMSDLDSSSGSDTDSRSQKGRRGRGRHRGDEDTDFESERHVAKSHGPGYGRSELFKVEKGLLVFGWGRWSDILSHTNWKRHMEEKDVEKVSRAILIYSLGHYKGDERIKEFIWDLVSPSGETVLKNHSGLSAPVPRGRKGRKNREDKEVKEDPKSFSTEEAIAGCKVDPNVVLGDNGYKKHLHRHSNKVLLRVRTLYYLKHEVLGQAAEAISKGVNVADINIPLPAVDVDPPAYWWDTEADKSLLVGVFKHGYEKYNLMRQDPTLTFLSRCGPPDGAALAAEMKDDDDDEDKVDQSIVNDNDEEDESVLSTSDVTAKKPASAAQTPAGTESEEGEKLPFPTVSDLNTRLRRIITNYQRDYKRQQQKKEQQAKKIEKREKMDTMVREREFRRRETQQRWVRREETDFYRVVSTYGIEFDRHKGRYIWDKFRQMAKLDKKTDDQLTEYFISFYHMCLRVCRKIKEDAYPPTPLYVEAITEERASRCIARIDLLSKIREEIIVHAKLRERIMLCKTSYDLPTWWINGFHDRELLIGAAKHGLAKTETFILGDPNFSFQKYCKPPEPTSQPNSPANFKLFGKDIGKVKDEPESSVKEEKSETKEDGAEVNLENKEDNPNTPTNPLDEDDEDTSEYHQEMLETMAKNSQAEEDKTKTDEEEDKVRTKHSKEEHETKIKVSDFIKKEVDRLTENGKEAKVKKEIVNSDEEDSKTDLKKKKDMDKDKTKKENSEEKDGKLKQEEEECGAVSVKKEIKGDPKGDDEDEEVRRTFEEGEGSRTEFFNKVKEGLSTHWPKDRIIFHRLEHICYCIETGEWPFGKKMPNPHILGIDSGSATPTSSRTPTLTPKGEEGSGQALQEMMKAKSKLEKDFEVQLSEGDGLKLTFHKRAKEKERRHTETMEADKAARIQQILAQSVAASTASSDESRPDSTLSTSQVSGPLPWQQPNSPYFFLSQTPDSLFMNGSPSAEAELMMNQSLLEQGFMFPGRRRGRKRKEEKLAEIAMAEALARRQMARAVASFEPDSRVPVINLEDGSRLAGDKAPLKKDLDAWLDQHPGYVIDRVDDELEEGEIVSDYSERRRGRKPKVDPAFLDVDKLTGEENVSVINRLTGKKITGAKAPPLRYLAEWLEQNPMWDVDPKWSDLVRAKGSLPKQLLPRVVTPNRRGRGRPARDSPPVSHSMLGTSDPHAAAAMAATLEAMNVAQLMAAGIPKLPLPFASLPPGIGLGNPLLGLSGMGIPGLPSTPPLSSKDSDSKRKDLEDKEGSKGESKSMSPHPSFPMLYNPLLYNPLFAAQGLGGFPLPTSLSSPSISSRLINGHAQSDSEDEPKSSKTCRTSEQIEQDEAEDLSVRSENKVVENLHEAHSSGKHKPEPVSDDSEQPCDLSMKSKSKEEPGTKIIGSDKLSRIVDSLKDRVNKMDGKPVSDKVKEGKKGKLDSLLFSLASQEKPSSVVELSSPSADRQPSLSSSSSDRRSSLTSPSADRRPSLTSLLSDRQSSSSERRPSFSDKQVVGSSERASTSKLLTSHSDTSLTRKASLSSPISLTSSSGVKPSTKEPVPQIVQELLAAKQLKDAAKLQKEMDLAAKQQRAIEALVAKQRQVEEIFFMKRPTTETKVLKETKEKASTSERMEKEGYAGKSKESAKKEDKA